MNYNEAIKYLYSLEKYGIKLGLERIKLFLKLTGNPEKNLKIIHVAGTNGKGSVCAMLSAVLQKAGYKTGMYISPHLYDFKERITVNNKKITEKDLALLVTKFKQLINKTKLTFFEAVTALAFIYFSKKVDFLVLEVGLGGRLDATNIAKPLVSVVTNIEKEHTDYLGSKIENIAKEKAGIIKNDIVVVTGAKGKALQVIKKICKEKNSKLIIAKKKIKTNLLGDFQKDNAGVAVSVVNALNKHHDTKISKKTISKALQSVKWPGRLEFRKNLLLDCCHNPAAAKEIKKFIKKQRYKKIILIIGILDDKDYKAIVKELVPLAYKTIITKPKINRALDPTVIAKEAVKYSNNFIVKPDVKEAVKYAKSINEKFLKKISGVNKVTNFINKEKDLILVTGSCYVVGEIK